MIYWTLFIVCLWSRSTSLKSSAHPSRVACLLLKNLDDDNGTKYTKAIGIEKVQKVGKELKAILEKLSNSEKYAMLLQSFRNRVLESRNATYRSEQFAMMRSLYSEMIQNSYRPEPSSATLFLDASSMMQDIYQMSFTCRIVKAGTVVLYCT